MKLSFPDVRMSVRASVSAGLAVFAAQLAQLEYPIYAMIATTQIDTDRPQYLAYPQNIEIGVFVSSNNTAPLKKKSSCKLYTCDLLAFFKWLECFLK